MAIKLNGNDITSNKLNGNDITMETLNGTQVYSPNATKWLYYGTTGSYSGTYTYSYSGGSCRISSQNISDLTSARPPSDYSVGYVMRVLHSTYTIDPWGQPVPISCQTRLYIAD